MRKIIYYALALLALVSLLAAIILAEGYGQRVEGIDIFDALGALGVFWLSLYGMSKLQEGD